MGLEDAKNQVDQAFTRDDLKGPSFENAFGGATSFHQGHAYFCTVALWLVAKMGKFKSLMHSQQTSDEP